ncbi:MAG TPA: 6-phosphogluconolactonase [Candidatus Acidoferrum sp.]|nr:6-phosphogluconolactonase [Candidatus Acidoferrum sp.]
MMTAVHEQRFDTAAALQQALLAWSIKCIEQDLRERSAISLLLSGGRTPIPFYCWLSQTDLPWQRIQLALVDERWVPVEDGASNEGAIRAAFFDNSTALAQLVAMKTTAAHAVNAVAECNDCYATLAWPPTLAVLGMGADGHTASLFAGAHGYEAALTSTAFCAAIEAKPSAVTGACTERMTLTLNALLQSRRIALLISGDDKWQVYRKALAAENPALPVSMVLRRAAAVEVFWSP